MILTPATEIEISLIIIILLLINTLVINYFLLRFKKNINKKIDEYVQDISEVIPEQEDIIKHNDSLNKE